MKEWFRKLRYNLAYLIAPDWIDDLEHRLSSLLCEVTGNRLSKPYYPLETMISETRDYQQKCCDECEYYLEYQKHKESVKEAPFNGVYFTAEQVRKMSSAEVRQNYDAIIASMKMWGKNND